MSFETGIGHFEKIFSVVPEVVAFDKHPDYLSTKYADHLTGVVKIPVQHHHAHIASCMVENNLSGKVIGIAYDGTGYGDDGQIWGGEFFVGDYSGFDRQAHFEYVPLPGGKIGIKEPWRMALSYLVSLGEDTFRLRELPFLSHVDEVQIDLVIQQIEKRIHSPLTSSVGRLFDAVSALAGLCNRIEYEGQAAIRLESIADSEEVGSYRYEILTDEVGYQVSVSSLISAIVTDVLQGREPASISTKFHRTMACITLDVCRLLREKFGLNRVALSGGVFQNRLLLGLILDFLEKDGFKVYTHSKVPTNDGGISLGQAAIAIKKYMK